MFAFSFPPLRLRCAAPVLAAAAALLLCLGACRSGADATSSADASNGSGPSYRLIGYVLGSRSADVPPEAARQLTHLNYAFANLRPDGEVVLEHEEDAARLKRLTALRRYNPDLKILLSVGGWSWSDHFSDAALTAEARGRFARSATALVLAHGLDGLDIDWEYPGQPGEGNTHRPADRKNFTRLLTTLRRHLDAAAREQPRAEGYLLTIAAAAGADYLRHTDMAEAQRVLDFVNLMTYDFHGSWTPRTGHHANLFAPADSIPSAAASVERFLEAGVPARKLVLGVPFYGRRWAGVQPARRGLHQPYAEAQSSLPFDSLSAHYVGRRGFQRHWDAAAQAPYLWNPDAAVFITYEDEASLRRKAAYVREEGLGGVMYWEESHDAGGVLRAVLYRHLR